MPVILKDETTGLDILYIDNSGNVGLGSIPNSGQSLTVQGQSLISASAQFEGSVLVAGSQAGYEGSIYVPAGGSASVAISTSQIPTVTSQSGQPQSVSTTSVVLGSTGTSGNVQYAIW